MGSWKMTEISLPRMARMAVSSRPTSSRPRNRMLPATMRPGGIGTNPRMDRAPTLLPQPDSPTMPSVSPRLKNQVFKSSTTSSGSAVSVRLRATLLGSISVRVLTSHAPRDARVEGTAQAVTHQVDGEHGCAKQQSWTEDQPGRNLEEGTALGHDVAPARDLRRRAGTEEAQDRFDQHGRGADVG